MVFPVNERRHRSVSPHEHGFRYTPPCLRSFGSSMEEDANKLYKRIKGIEARIGKLHHLIELRQTVIGAL